MKQRYTICGVLDWDLLERRVRFVELEHNYAVEIDWVLRAAYAYTYVDAGGNTVTATAPAGTIVSEDRHVILKDYSEVATAILGHTGGS
ncbi:MAG TPA: hypothetical protein VK467_04090 [Gemmatimonadales bacterium]|nr:hypothetical protein [Gemmatimonadales bacterium]